MNWAFKSLFSATIWGKSVVILFSSVSIANCSITFSVLWLVHCQPDFVWWNTKHNKQTFVQKLLFGISFCMIVPSLVRLKLQNESLKITLGHKRRTLFVWEVNFLALTLDESYWIMPHKPCKPRAVLDRAPLDPIQCDCAELRMHILEYRGLAQSHQYLVDVSSFQQRPSQLNEQWTHCFTLK
jgi:hypothetical protein